MADENYAIRVSFDGIDKAISDIKTLQSAIGNIKAPVLNLGGADASNIAVAALKKLQLEIDSLEKKKAQSGANDATRSAAFISQLEKQKAASAVRVSDGTDKEAARVAQELLRYKQQLAAIDAKLINPADIANAKALASEINKLNLDKIKKGFDDASPVTFNQFIGATTEKARDLAEQLQNTLETFNLTSDPDWEEYLNNYNSINFSADVEQVKKWLDTQEKPEQVCNMCGFTGPKWQNGHLNRHELKENWNYQVIGIKS